MGRQFRLVVYQGSFARPAALIQLFESRVYSVSEQRHAEN